MKDILVAGLLLLGAELFLLQRNLAYLSVWLLLITIVLAYGTRMKYTAAVIIAIIAVLAVILVSGQKIREGMEVQEASGDNNSNGNGANNNTQSTEEPEPHMDKAQTMMNAFKSLSPKQVAAMREDTKELMETQQQLMDTLSNLGPQVQQGVELVKSFQGMFGGNLFDVVKQQ